LSFYLSFDLSFYLSLFFYVGGIKVIESHGPIGARSGPYETLDANFSDNLTCFQS